MLSPYDQDKAITSNHITSLQHCIRRLSQGNKTRKRSKSTHVRKEKRESLFEDDIIDYTQNPNRMYQKDTRTNINLAKLQHESIYINQLCFFVLTTNNWKL